MQFNEVVLAARSFHGHERVLKQAWLLLKALDSWAKYWEQAGQNASLKP